MSSSITGVIYLELKYCERCGGLGIRPAGTDLQFCAACSRVLAGLSPNRNLATHIRHKRLPARDLGHTNVKGGEA